MLLFGRFFGCGTLFAALWLVLFVVAHYYGAPSESADLRLVPLEKEDFFAGLPDTGESFVMICFPYDPMSCNIAALYRNQLASHWTPAGPTIFDLSNPATFKGVNIIDNRRNDRPALGP
jgi:hypothetical protein